jgi:hypothetical protein
LHQGDVEKRRKIPKRQSTLTVRKGGVADRTNGNNQKNKQKQSDSQRD